jgi:hypothetical protein
MAVDAARPVIVVQLAVEQPLAVGAPDRLAGHVGHAIRQFLAGRHVQQLHRVIFGALVVAAIGEQLVIGAVCEAAEREICKALGKFVAVEQHLTLTAGARLAAEQRMLTADDIAAEIGPFAIRRRYGGVVLLDPALHLLEQRFLERRRALHRACRIGVLRKQISADVLGKDRWIAHDLLPVVGPQPGVFIVALLPVMDGKLRPPLRDRRGGQHFRRCQVHGSSGAIPCVT